VASKNFSISTFRAIIPWGNVLNSPWTGKHVTVSWDEAKTTFMGAELHITKASTDHDPVVMTVRFNGTNVKDFIWGEGTKSVDQQAVIDISSIIKNGENFLEIIAQKTGLYPYLDKVITSISSYIKVIYEGEEPKGKGLWEMIKEWFDKYWVVTIPVAVLAVMLTPRRRRG